MNLLRIGDFEPAICYFKGIYKKSTLLMDEELKKAIMLLKSLIFHYHGLDDEEMVLLDKAADRYAAHEALLWANNFIAQDYLSAFERSEGFLLKVFSKLTEADQIKHLMEVWEENHKKGYVTEMETTAMLKLAKDWQIEMLFLQHINH